ncbi:unnamed protein product, partial [Closterium sp. Naga37s-1]
MFSEEAADKTRKCKCCPTRISFKKSSTRSGERHYKSKHNAHYAIWKRMYEGGLVPSDATFPEGGYPGVPHSGEEWPYAEAYPNVPPGVLVGGGVGGGQGTMDQFMAPKLAKGELRATIVKFVVMTDSSFLVVDNDAGRIFEITVRVLALNKLMVYVFKEMLTVANPLCGKPNVIPSRWTIARDVTRYADMARALAMAELELEEEEVLPLFRNVSPMCMGMCMGMCKAACHCVSPQRCQVFDPYVPNRCMAHALNLADQKALGVETVKEALQRIRDMATFVGLSPKRMVRFRKELKDSYPSLCDLKLVLDCEVRWGSTYAMVARALRLRRPLSAHVANEQVSVA